MKFFLGTHKPHWLALAGVPLFVSNRTLKGRRQLPRAIAAWALDSGGFSELSLYGRWVTTPEEYAASALRYREEVGSLEWAAIQDWMCEPIMLAKTGKTIAEHQRLSIESYTTLQGIAPSIPWAPVLQGWAIADYLSHARRYEAAGVDLDALPIVGVGSVCRRQATSEAVELFAELAGLGLSLHGFGLKVQGLKRCAASLTSSDSLAWSYQARREKPLPGCPHASCANCLKYAMRWRERVLQVIGRPQQSSLCFARDQ